MAFDLTSPIANPLASRYANPAAGASRLPIVYGDFSAFGLTGPLPTVLVDTVNFYYCAAAHAVGSITEVWVGSTKKTIGVDVTVATASNLESQGTIATLKFSAAQTDVVTWRGTGAQSGGATITNPVSQVEHLLETYGGLAAADFDAAALEQARRAVADLAYATAWVLADASEAGQWLTEMLWNVLGTWRIDGLGRVVLLITRNQTHFSPSEVAAHVVAARDCLDGDDGVEMMLDLDQLVNALDVDYAYHWDGGSYSSTITSNTSDASINAYGTQRKRIQLRGVRSSAHVNGLAALLFATQDYRSGVEGAQIRFTLRGVAGARLAVYDPIGFSWAAFGPTREQGNPYRNECLRVLEVSKDMTGEGRTEVSARDLGGFILDGRAKFNATVKYSGTTKFGGSGRSADVMI